MTDEPRDPAIVLTLFAIVFLHAPAVIRFLNPVFKRFLGAGLPGGPQFVQAAYGEVNWVRNLRASRAAVVTKGHDSKTLEAIELAPETAAPILRDALAPYRRSSLLRTVLGSTARPPVAVLRFFRIRVDDTLEEYVAEARRHPIFELRPRAAALRDGLEVS